MDDFTIKTTANLAQYGTPVPRRSRRLNWPFLLFWGGFIAAGLAVVL